MSVSPGRVDEIALFEVDGGVRYRIFLAGVFDPLDAQYWPNSLLDSAVLRFNEIIQIRVETI